MEDGQNSHWNFKFLGFSWYASFKCTAPVGLVNHMKLAVVVRSTLIEANLEFVPRIFTEHLPRYTRLNVPRNSNSQKSLVCIRDLQNGVSTQGYHEQPFKNDPSKEVYVPSVGASGCGTGGFMMMGLVYQRHENGGGGCGSGHVLMDPYSVVGGILERC
ncbi:hypothetical protein LWI29_019454 [Acer saccharum]|uniref:Uncharacterized protein n=1 Tax=Acer saccharum TaxID=4024 RepID=A0AA39S784_ACESA|nr:hypothetical protein LWI29_019454 [Acer saccharum]